MPAPRVFISYSHDSDAHRGFVLSLSNRLRADGLDCQIDQYVNGFPAEGWQRWMETQVEAADFVLVVCTPLYLKRYRGLDRDGGRGVTFEGVVISQSLYDVYYQNTKFVPVLPEGGAVDDVPMPLKGFGAFGLMGDYEGLYRFLTGQPTVVLPEVGDQVVLGAGFGSAQPSGGATNPAQPSGSATEPRPERSRRASQVPVADLSPQQPKQGFSKPEGMTDTMKAAWMAGVFALLAAVIAGLFALFAAPDITISGSDCASVNMGEVSGVVSQDCGGKDEK